MSKTAWLLAVIVVGAGAGLTWWLTRGPAPSGPPVELYALLYGRSQFRGDYVMEGASPDKVDFGWVAFAFRTPEGWGLVDCGFTDPAMAERFHLSSFTPPAEVLKGLKVEADQVVDIVLTHGHWDHAGGLEAFPKARLWMSRAELEDMRSRLSDETWTQGYRREDLDRLEKALAEGRLRLLDDRASIRPGVEAIRMGGHTAGCLAVRFSSGTLLTSDNAYLYRNLEERRGVGPEARLTGQDVLPELLRMGGTLVPGHDPLIFQRYPQVAPGIVRLP